MLKHKVAFNGKLEGTGCILEKRRAIGGGEGRVWVGDQQIFLSVHPKYQVEFWENV